MRMRAPLELLGTQFSTTIKIAGGDRRCVEFPADFRAAILVVRPERWMVQFVALVNVHGPSARFAVAVSSFTYVAEAWRIVDILFDLR